MQRPAQARLLEILQWSIGLEVVCSTDRVPASCHTSARCFQIPQSYRPAWGTASQAYGEELDRVISFPTRASVRRGMPFSRTELSLTTFILFGKNIERRQGILKDAKVYGYSQRAAMR